MCFLLGGQGAAGPGAIWSHLGSTAISLRRRSSTHMTSSGGSVHRTICSHFHPHSLPQPKHVSSLSPEAKAGEAMKLHIQKAWHQRGKTLRLKSDLPMMCESQGFIPLLLRFVVSFFYSKCFMYSQRQFYNPSMKL